MIAAPENSKCGNLRQVRRIRGLGTLPHRTPPYRGCGSAARHGGAFGLVNRSAATGHPGLTVEAAR